MTNINLNTLEQLLGCYFHQDWEVEFESDMSALSVIVEYELNEQLSAGAIEIDMLLGERISEYELRSILVDKIGCYFDPASKGITSEQWLRYVREKFA